MISSTDSIWNIKLKRADGEGSWLNFPILRFPKQKIQTWLQYWAVPIHCELHTTWLHIYKHTNLTASLTIFNVRVLNSWTGLSLLILFPDVIHSYGSSLHLQPHHRHFPCIGPIDSCNSFSPGWCHGACPLHGHWSRLLFAGFRDGGCILCYHFSSCL